LFGPVVRVLMPFVPASMSMPPAALEAWMLMASTPVPFEMMCTLASKFDVCWIVRSSPAASAAILIQDEFPAMSRVNAPVVSMSMP